MAGKGRVRKIPDGIDPTKKCPSCEATRGNKIQGWNAIKVDGQIIGFTCPDCPKWSDPINRIDVKGQPRFRATVDKTPKGAKTRKQVSRTFDVLDDAYAWVEEVRNELEKTSKLASHDLTIDEAFEQWLVTAEIEPPTKRNYKSQFAPVSAAIGKMRVKDVTSFDVEDIVTSMKSGGKKRDGSPYGKWAIRSAIGRLSQTLDRLVAHGVLDENVTKVVSKPKDKRGKRKDFAYWKTVGTGAEAYSPEQDKFRQVSDKHRDAGAWRLALAGMTRADICGLKWEDIDLEEGKAEVKRSRVILDGKNDYVGDAKSDQRYRIVPCEELEPGTTKLLKEMKLRQLEEKMKAGKAYTSSGYVVVDELGNRIRPELFSDRFRSLCRQAGVTVINLHKTRHTLAALMNERGYSVRRAAYILGHTISVHVSSYLPDADAEDMSAPPPIRRVS